MLTTILKRFESPDEVRTFPHGRFELIKVGSMTIGRGTYEPGWKWSNDIQPIAGTESCQIQHVGISLSGQLMVALDGGEEKIVNPGDVFYIPPGHDSWVVGNETHVALHFIGADAFAK